MKRKQITAMITAMTMVLGITACGSGNVSAEQENKEQTEIESTLNISNNDEITWSYDSQSDSWTMSVTCAVANPELPDYQGVSVNVPGAYVKGLMCRWFRVAVLPLDGELAAALLYRGSRKRCAVCGAAFVPKSNRGKYCPDCAGRIKKIKAAERKRKQRQKCHALEPFKPA